MQLFYYDTFLDIMLTGPSVMDTCEGLGNFNVVSSHGYNAVCIFVSVGVDISADGPV